MFESRVMKGMFVSRLSRMLHIDHSTHSSGTLYQSTVHQQLYCTLYLHPNRDSSSPFHSTRLGTEKTRTPTLLLYPATMSSAKAALVIKLADLLGFEEGANDVLEYLLSIESSEVRSILQDTFITCAPTQNVITSVLSVLC